MTTKEAAEFLGMSIRTFHRRIANGEINPLPSAPGLIRPKRLLFLREDVEKLNQPRKDECSH